LPRFTLLRASTDYKTLVKAVDESLQALELSFTRNGHETVTEFEIASPAYFRIVIEPNRMPKSQNLLIPTITPPKGSTLDIRFDLDSNEDELKIATEQARSFVNLLVDSLPTKPWIGLGTLASRREEKNWKEFSEGSRKEFPS
jgi:hypothetical protein